MSETDNEETTMAECGSCRAVIPSDSTECPECNIKFSGMSEDELGECGACGFLVPLESTSCSSCGVIFVADDVMDVLRKWLSSTGLTIQSLFEKFDTNGDGMIDSDELKQGLLNLNLADLPPSQVQRLVEQIDADGNGEIDLAELEKSVTGSDYVAPDNEAEASSDEDTEEEDESVDEEFEEEEEESDDEESEEEESDDEESEEEESDDESEETSDTEPIEVLPDDIIKKMIDVMDRDGSNPATIFHALDEDGDKFISTEELSNTISDVLEDEDIAESSIADFVATLDVDSDGNIDIIEFVSALEEEIGNNPEEYDDDDDDDDDDDEEYDDGTDPKEFPSPMQSAMMSKKWNDVWWPLIHATFFLFILAWVVNGFIGPVDGSGGLIELESNYGIGLDGYDEGEIYPCDSDEQLGGCANSLTPFSGENGASSMPKGFYTDGIIFILLGAIGMGGSMFTHLVLAKGWRARVKAMKEVESDTEDAKESSESEEDDVSEEEDEEESNEEEDASEDSEEESEDEESEEDGSEEDDDEEDDDIDIGSHIGLTVEEEDVFGVIVEFDDEDGLVTIKEDGTGDEITGYQDEMFLE